MQDYYELLTPAQLAEVDRRASAGATLLDKRGPEGWAQTLNENEERLNVGDVDNCPLAIVFGDYGLGLRKLGLHDLAVTDDTTVSQQAARIGVTLRRGDTGLDSAPGRDDTAWTREAFRALTEAWRREIVRRQLV